MILLERRTSIVFSVDHYYHLKNNRNLNIFPINILGVPRKMFLKYNEMISRRQSKFNILSFISNQFDLKHET